MRGRNCAHRTVRLNTAVVFDCPNRCIMVGEVIYKPAKPRYPYNSLERRLTYQSRKRRGICRDCKEKARPNRVLCKACALKNYSRTLRPNAGRQVGESSRRSSPQRGDTQVATPQVRGLAGHEERRHRPDGTDRAAR